MDLCIPRAVLALLVLGYCYAQELILTPNEGSILAAADEGVLVRCEATGLADGEAANLQWKDKGEKVVGTWSLQNQRIFVSPSGSRLNLEFNPLKEGDEGMYTCHGTINGENRERDIKIEVFSPIVIHSDPEQHPVIYTEALIECEVTGNPKPEVSWRYNNQSEIRGPRYRQDTKGLYIKNITKADNGIYICRATHTVDKIKVQTLRIDVSVTVPPSLKGPPSVENLVVGKKTEIVCEAEGTPPPKFTFTKDNQPLTGERYKISTESNHNLQIGKLTIEKLEDTDEGDYKCVATNAGGSISDSVFVDTIVPPTVADIASISEQEKLPAALTCIAKGDPAPAITWRIKGSQTAITDTERITIETATRTENLIEVVTSKLKIKEVASSDTNNYTCMATNTAGKEEKTGSIVVRFSPKFDNTKENSAYGWLNHDTEIKCVIDAEPLPVVTWLYKNNPVSKSQVNTVVGVRQVTTVLTVSVNIGNEKDVFGAYICKAENTQGKGNYTINLIQAVNPSAPKITVAGKTPTTIELVIEPPDNDGGQAIKDYKIEYFAEGDAENTITRQADISSNPDESRTRFIIDKLTANTAYKILVEARNNVGYGATVDLMDTTPTVRRPETPKIISPKDSDSSTAYRLMWEKPLTGGAPLSSYSIEYNQVELDASGKVERVVGETLTDSIPSTETSFTIPSLKASSHYQIKLTAINRKGSSNESKIVFKTAVSGAEDGSTAREVSVDSSSDGRATLPAKPTEKDAAAAAVDGDDTEPAMATSAIIGILIAVVIILLLVIDVTFYFTKQCGLLWTLRGKVAGREAGAERTDAEAADHEKEAFLKEGKQDSEEPVAKENVDVVDETEKGGDGDEKMKELEPEDKEEKPDAEPAEAAKEEAAPASSPQKETAATPEAAADEGAAPEATTAGSPTEEKDPKV